MKKVFNIIFLHYVHAALQIMYFIYKPAGKLLHTHFYTTILKTTSNKAERLF